MELHIPPSRLERRVGLLLRAYPPGYREDRGEEMLGTLLEATPEGRDWPAARDSWSLLAGGLRARRAVNRQLGLATSLRQAVVLGLALYVSWAASQFFTTDALFRAHGPAMLAGVLLAATALAVWAGRRALMITTVAASLAVLAYYCYVYYWRLSLSFHHRLPIRFLVLEFTPVVPLLLAMLALVHLSRRDGRPPRSWLILACTPLLAIAAERTQPFLLRFAPAPGVLFNLLPDVFLLLAIPAVAWLATDARPALGVALAVGASELVPMATIVQANIYDRQTPLDLWRWIAMDAAKLALAIAMTVALAWMLRRRTRPRPHQRT
jgi:hypothetical protein